MSIKMICLTMNICLKVTGTRLRATVVLAIPPLSKLLHDLQRALHAPYQQNRDNYI